MGKYFREQAMSHLNQACLQLEASEREIEQRTKELDEDFAGVRKAKENLDTREKNVAGREYAMEGVRGIAAERKARIAVLEDNQAQLNEQRKVAEAETRKAQAALKETERVVERLLWEKKELEARVKALTPATIENVTS